MINRIVEGSKETSLHDFKITVNGLDIVISDGTYYQAGKIKFTKSDSTSLSVISTGCFGVWLTDSGFEIVPENEQPANPIDRLMWFKANQKELTDVHFVKVIGRSEF